MTIISLIEVIGRILQQEQLFKNVTRGEKMKFCMNFGNYLFYSSLPLNLRLRIGNI